MTHRQVSAAVLAMFTGVLALGLALTLASVWQEPVRGLFNAVQAALPDSRVANPVTAVLLDYRGYDTLLELGVLLLAWLGAATAGGDAVAARQPVAPPIARSMGRLLLAPIVLASAYVLWAGADAPGGAFQAGAMGASAVVVWRLSDAAARPLPGQLLLAPLGFAVFLTVALATLILSGVFIGYPRAAVRELMLLIELAAAVSVTVILAALFETMQGVAGRGIPR